MGCTASQDLPLNEGSSRFVPAEPAVDRSERVLGLSLDLLRYVLSEWLSSKDIMNLDSAACSKRSRTLLMTVLNGFKLCHANQGLVGGRKIFKWLLKRNVITDALDLTSGQYNIPDISEYLITHGHHLCQLSDDAEGNIREIIMHCPNLTRIENLYMKLANGPPEDIVAIQQYCPMIDSVQLVNRGWVCNISDLDHWRNLRQIDFYRFNFVIMAVQLIVANNPNLETIAFHFCSLGKNSIDGQSICEIIAGGCPKLKCLDFGDIGSTITDADLQLLAAHCPDLHTYHFRGDVATASWTAAGVRCLLQQCANLSTLTFRSAPRAVLNTLLTADVASASAQTAWTSLTSVTFDICPDLTGVIHFLDRCPALAELKIEYCSGVDGGILGALLAHCPHIRSLHLLGTYAFTEIDVAHLWLLLPRLRVLRVDPTLLMAVPELIVKTRPGRGEGCRIIVD